MDKYCKQCGKHIKRDKKLSITQWERKKFCSRKCQSVGKDMSWFVPPLKGKKIAKPRKCSECSEISEKVFYFKPYKKLVCNRHYAQLVRHGKILWDKRKLITPLTQRIRRSKKNVNWRKAVFQRDNFHCVQCSRTNCYLEADHFPLTFTQIFHDNKITTFKEAMNCEQFWDINNGRTLCLFCHRGDKAYSIKHRAYDNRRIQEKERIGRI